MVIEAGTALKKAESTMSIHRDAWIRGVNRCDIAWARCAAKV